MDNLYAQVLYDFKASFADELSVSSGEILQILYKIDADWMYVKSLMAPYQESGGILPTNHMRVFKIPKCDASAQLFLAIENFGEKAGDLYFLENEILVGKNRLDENWFYGHYLNDSSKTGIFPISHVIEIIHMDNKERKDQLVEAESIPEKKFLPNKPQRQAKTLHSFESESNDPKYKYLNFSAGQYLFIHDTLDENWLIGEKLNGEKGLIPIKYVEFVEQEKIPLNRTQSNFKGTSVLNDSIAEETTAPLVQSASETKLDVNHNEPKHYSVKYCHVNFDFKPESDNELGCLKGEYLKILKINLEKSEWLEAENVFGKKGMVPVNFVTLMYEQNSAVEKLFENDKQKKLKNRSLSVVNNFSSISLNELKRINTENQSEVVQKAEIDSSAKEITEQITTRENAGNDLTPVRKYRPENKISKTSKMFEEIINQTKTESKLVQLQRHNRFSSLKNDKTSDTYLSCSSLNLSSTPVSPGINAPQSNTVPTYRKPPDPPIKSVQKKPPIPPKPTSYTSNSRNNGSIKINSSYSRPVIYNNELLDKIKSLESIIQKRHTDQMTYLKNQLGSDSFEADRKQEIELEKSNLECLKSDLSNMKNLFVESAPNRQLAMAQIDSDLNRNSLSTLADNDDLTRSVPNQEADTEKKLKKKQIERKMTVQELFETEKDFAYELSLVYSAFVTDCIETPPAGFNKIVLFEELKAVIRFSNQLVENLDAELNEKNLENIRVGLKLIEVSDEMKDIYAKYLQNHANITLLLKNYESNPETNFFINNRLNTLKDKVKVANLQSLLIKPVQRIFKYPLFLKRIHENTDPSHDDYENLTKAIEVFTKMLEYINEYKRRKDIVNKYLNKLTAPTDYTDMSITDLFKKMSLKSMAKKTTRLSVQLTRAVGWFDQQIIDENFKREEDKFKLIEISIRKFLKALNEYLTCLKDVLTTENTIFNDVLVIFDDEFQTFRVYEALSNKHLKENYSKYYDNLRKEIETPLSSLSNLFNGPNKLIDKRYDKLVDYEAVLSDYKLKSSSGPILKELEHRMEQAKNDYEALNDQLVEDLPKLTKASTRIFLTSIKRFMTLTRNFFALIKIDLKEQNKKSEFEIKSHHRRPPKLEFSFQRNTSIFFTEDDQFFNSSGINKNQTDDNILNLKRNYSAENLYRVFKDYNPDEKLRQLNQNINDIVGLVKPYDPSGQKHIWLVDNGIEKGFIPCEVLERYTQTAEANLINFDDDNDDIFNRSTNDDNKTGIEKYFVLNTIDEYCIASYDFKAIKYNMIDLVEGKIYKVREKCDKKGDPSWWLVESSDDKIGYVPSNYVKLLD